MTEQGRATTLPSPRGNYWTYSAGVAIAWAIVLTLRGLIGGGSTLRDTFLIFGGFAIGWVSLTIARFVYPPPKRWQ